MKWRNYQRPKKDSGWYCFSANGKKSWGDTRTIDRLEDEEIRQSNVRPFCTKYVNGVKI